MNESLPDMETTQLHEPPLVHPGAVAQPVKRHISPVPLVAGGVIIIGLIILFVVSKQLNTPNDSIVQVVETPTPTPTPIRILSTIASQSAYVALEQAHTSLTTALNGTNLDDPSLSPPVLDLPLGFHQ